MNWWHGNTSLKCFLKNVYCMLAWCVSVCVWEGGGKPLHKKCRPQSRGNTTRY